MSELAYIRFTEFNLLTDEEKENKDEVIEATEEVLAARGIECDEKCAKLTKEECITIVKQMRIVRRKKKKVNADTTTGSVEIIEEEEEQQDKKEVVYAGAE